MADAQEDTPAAGEEVAEQVVAEGDQPAEESQKEESEAVEQQQEEAGVAEPQEGAESENVAAVEEAPSDVQQEGEEQKPDEEGGEGGEEEKAAEQGEVPAEAEQQGDEQAAEAADGGHAESKEDVEPSENVDGVEPGAQTEGDGSEEDARPAEEGEEKEKSDEADGEKPEEEGEEESEKKVAPEEEKQPKEGEQEAAEGETTAEDGEAVPQQAEEEDTAAEGAEQEAEEGPIVGERLSRGATPEVDGAVLLEQERLEATTPDKLSFQEGEGEEEVPAGMDMVEGEELEEEEEEPQFRREELIERYHEALIEREQLQQQNYSLQHKLAEYFRKKKADERQDYDKNVTDQEQRYLKYMAQLEDLRRQDDMEKENYRAQIEDAKERCQEKKEKVDGERKKFMEFKKNVAMNAINSRSGKPVPPKDIEQYMVNEVKKEQEVVNVRLENIKLKNKLKKKEQQLKSKEELAEGLHLIDFEQLKIENQTYNEKIEERNEELLKLRKKITSTVQVLTHLKEKLQFVQVENLEQNNNLKEVEASLAQSRDILSRTKQARDALRIDNHKLRQNCGLLGNEPLLRDFEERKDEGDDLRVKLEQLKMQHAELTLHCNQVRRKIDQTRQTMG